ncbi:MAG: carboxypeptidase-like regulatory domain-containing protein [Methanobacteriota archaeon]
MPRRAPLAAVLFVAAGLAGCIGSGDEPLAPAASRGPLVSKATVGQGVGGIQGLVTDPAIVPLSGAVVTVTETGEQAETVVDGSFAFSLLSPGTYTLVASLEGFEAESRTVEVAAGAVAVADFVLPQLSSAQPFHDVLEFAGFIECSVDTPVIGIAICALPGATPLGQNATNDKFLFTWNSGPSPQTWVVELQWTPGLPTSRSMFVVLEPDGIPNNFSTRYASDLGGSPLLARADRPVIENVDANLTKICDGEWEVGPLDSKDDYCRDQYAEAGGPVWSRVFVDGRLTSDADPSTLGFAFQQAYTLYASMFYHAPAPPDWSVVAEQG